MNEPIKDVIVEDRHLIVWRPVGNGWAMVGDRRHETFPWSEIQDRGPFGVFERQVR